MDFNPKLQKLQEYYNFNINLLKEKEDEINSYYNHMFNINKIPMRKESSNHTMSDFDSYKNNNKPNRAEQLKVITYMCQNYISSIKDKIESLDFPIEVLTNARNHSNDFHPMEIDYYLKIYRMIFNELFFMEFNTPNAFCTEENIVKYLFSIEKDKNQHIKIIPCFYNYMKTEFIDKI